MNLKHLFLTTLFFISTLFSWTQSLTVNVTEAGGLSVAIKSAGGDVSTLTKLTVTGAIDARDFKVMRDSMPELAEIDLSDANIETYVGTDGTMYDVNINYPAYTIPEMAFKLCQSLLSITLPESTIAIGANAFDDCLKVTSINLPSTITSIGERAFEECLELSSIVIPSSIDTINLGTFRGCGITSITIPSSVVYIGEDAFSYCFSLNTVAIPSSVIAIGDRAFSNCTALNTVTIPASVTTIGEHAFLGSKAGITVEETNPNYSSQYNILFNKDKTTLIFCSPTLTSINIPASVADIDLQLIKNCTGPIIVDEANPDYSSEDGMLFNKTKTTLLKCPVSRAGEYVIPSTVTTIGDQAFYNCEGLTSITIPVSITSLGNEAFSYCRSLATLYVNWVTPPDLTNSTNLFAGLPFNTCILYVPAGTKTAYEETYFWMDFENIQEYYSSSSINANQNLSVQVGVYPNPATSHICIQNAQDNAWIEIYNLQGQIIKQTQLDANQNQVDISTLHKGAYVIKAIINGKCYTMKFIKME